MDVTLYRYPMSSVHLSDAKPNWFCHFYDPEGFRRKRTTGTTTKRIASTICTAMQRAAALAGQGKLSNERALKLIRETCAQIQETHGLLPANRAHEVLKSSIEEFIKIAGGELTSYTIESWLNGWLAGRTDASKATLVAYRQVVGLFLKHLGVRASRSITALQSKEIEDFKTKLAARVAPSTVNRAIKVLKASFNKAVEKRQLEFNPAEHVEYIEAAESTRRPFTGAEMKKLISAANDEWHTMIFVAYYTGLRLRDCSNLTWREVDLQSNTINLVTKKTRRRQILPIADPLNRHLLTLAGDDPDAPLCPALHGKPAAWLSAQFYDVMVKAKLAPERGHESTGKGRDARRDTSRISFHSFRYNTTTALRSAGVGESIAMDIVGHETEAVHRSYGNTELDAKREAINKLPDITQ